MSDTKEQGGTGIQPSPLEPVVVGRYRTFNVYTFDAIDLTLFNNNMLSVDGGVMHGHWRMEGQNFRFKWHKFGVQEFVEQYLYFEIAKKVWAHKSEDGGTNAVMVPL